MHSVQIFPHSRIDLKKKKTNIHTQSSNKFKYSQQKKNVMKLK